MNRKLTALALALLLLLAAGCGGNHNNSSQPTGQEPSDAGTVPSEPETPETPQEPETPPSAWLPFAIGVVIAAAAVFFLAWKFFPKPGKRL